MNYCKHIVFPFVLAAAFMLFSLKALPAGDFESDYRLAKQMTSSQGGGAYDRQLGMYYQSLPGWERDMTKCLKQNPGPQKVYGFFRFEDDGTYKLELKPNSKFANCLANVHMGRKPPRPPRLPYLNAFDFTFDG
jgi:hypothetical protein